MKRRTHDYPFLTTKPPVDPRNDPRNRAHAEYLRLAGIERDMMSHYIAREVTWGNVASCRANHARFMASAKLIRLSFAS
jgi:hypothetical protein